MGGGGGEGDSLCFLWYACVIMQIVAWIFLNFFFSVVSVVLVCILNYHLHNCISRKLGGSSDTGLKKKSRCHSENV